MYRLLSSTLVLLVAACSGPSSTTVTTARDSSPAPTPSIAVMSAPGPLISELDPGTRALLRPRMTRHGRDISDLFGAIRAGDLHDVRDLARAIADEPQIARVDGSDLLNARLSDAFFDRQTALATAAARLANATTGDARAVPAAFDHLIGACHGCHSAPAQ